VIPKPIYTLIDGEEMSREHPQTFEIPSLEEREGLRLGDYAKVGLVLDDAFVGPAGCGGERMWFEIIARSVGGKKMLPLVYRGKLANDPVVIKGLAHGDLVTFSPRHVLSIEKKHELAHDC
jgi:hypothetical protein